MDKQTVNRICDSLTSLADNLAEQERIVRGLEAHIRSLKYEVTLEELEKKTPDADRWDRLEKLLKEALEGAKTKDKGSPYINTPFPNPGPSDWPPLPPITCGVKVTPCNSTQTVSSVFAGVPDATVKTINKPL